MEQFVARAAGEDAIRAAVVIGSRAREDHPADEWADLDILVLSTETSRYAQDPGWVAAIGDAWMSFIEPTAAGHGSERRVLYDGGVDVDFAFFAVDEVQALFRADPQAARIALGRGFRVLLDKDGLVPRLFDGNPPAEAEAALLPDAATVEGSRPTSGTTPSGRRSTSDVASCGGRSSPATPGDAGVLGRPAGGSRRLGSRLWPELDEVIWCPSSSRSTRCSRAGPDTSERGRVEEWTRTSPSVAEAPRKTGATALSRPARLLLAYLGGGDALAVGKQRCLHT